MIFLQKKVVLLDILLYLCINYKAPPFFLEWTWPSEDGFFCMNNMAQRVTFYIDGFNFYYELQLRPKGQFNSPQRQAYFDVQERAPLPWCNYARRCDRRNETLWSTWKVETSKHRKICLTVKNRTIIIACNNKKVYCNNQKLYNIAYCDKRLYVFRGIMNMLQ